jgi:tetratricopeptide (TPR) repeat protein
MLSEHNPIAELVHQIQKKWTDEVSPFPEFKMVRWLIKPEEARLYEGFLKLESTEHGAIHEVLVCMLSPFKSEETYSIDLINDWIKAFREDNKTQEKLKAAKAVNSWNPERFSPKPFFPDNTYDHQLLEMLSSFQQEMMDKSMRLVVALFPHSIHDMERYKRWLTTMLKMKIPKEITFMIFDHIGDDHFDEVFNKYPEITKSLHINLDLDGAISKISKMGDANSPEVKFRECILEMGQSLHKNDRKRLDEWGEKALLITQKSGMKSLFSTAHIVYAGMLFNFKQFDKIDALLTRGLSIAKQGLQLEGPSCKPLLIQYYGYIASSKQLQKKMDEAIYAFERQGDVAMEYQLPGMALTPYRQAYTLSKKHLSQRYDELLQKAFSVGSSMVVEEQSNSCFAAIAYDFLQWNEARQQWDEAEKIDLKLKEIFGNDWKVRAKDPQAAYKIDTKKPVAIN